MHLARGQGVDPGDSYRRGLGQVGYLVVGGDAGYTYTCYTITHI